MQEHVPRAQHGPEVEVIGWQEEEDARGSSRPVELYQSPQSIGWQQPFKSAANLDAGSITGTRNLLGRRFQQEVSEGGGDIMGGYNDLAPSHGV